MTPLLPPFPALCRVSAAGPFPVCDRVTRVGEISTGRGLGLLSRRGNSFGIRPFDLRLLPVRPGIASGVPVPGQPEGTA